MVCSDCVHEFAEDFQSGWKGLLSPLLLAEMAEFVDGGGVPGLGCSTLEPDFRELGVKDLSFD